MKDLFVLVADKNMEFTLRGALSRPESLGVRPIDFTIFVHVNRDGGVRGTGVEIANTDIRNYTHALLLLDFEGSGTNHTAIELEKELDQQLAQAWGTAAKAIVIDPELDIWVWGSDNALHQTVGRISESESIREWLKKQNFQFTDHNKPTEPKEALEKILYQLRRPRSSSLYEKIAKVLSMKSCTDPAFIRFRKQLQAWFPVERH